MKIWFNHWFSTAYHFIDMLKEKGYYVVATNERETCVYKENANEFYLEPVFENKDEYLNWCLDFCKKHNIKIFFVKRNMDIIVKNIHLFEEKNIKVICENDYEKYSLLQNKYKTMEYFKELNICNVPEMKIVNTISEFKQVYKEMSQKYDNLCIKYNIDEGGQSYKLISDREPNLDRISENNGLVYSYDYICKCLESVENFKDLVIMPYLNGTEISIDCLGFGNDLLAIPRYKLNNRVTKLDMDEELIHIAKQFYNALKLNGPFNIQFRYHNNVLYLLEINTRLSGGSWKAKYIGCEFPNLCVDKFLGKLTKFPKVTKKEVNLSNIESVVELNL